MSFFIHFAVVGAALLGLAIYRQWFGTKRMYSFLLMFAPVVLLTILFIFTISLSSYRWARLTAAFNPSVDPNGMGYMSIMVRRLLEGAVLSGRGNIPIEYVDGLTEPYSIFYTDLLLTALVSLLGWITFAIIMGALLFFIVKGFMLCFKQKSSLGLFVSVAIMLTFSIQTISYIVFNLGIQFVSPISLPLISYSNTATIINLVLIGFMLSVFRTGDVVTDEKIQSVAKHQRFISWTGGKLIINFKG